ncbi:MAG: peptide chain release factor N(5)-glutamine methyltransferase [Hyphomicrobiales bacterium]|nr:peptide chain release factor N(5)-glutamine methyltransferase [Hyphomicrobiales bacterium]
MINPQAFSPPDDGAGRAPTLAGLFRETVSAFHEKGIDTPELGARLLICAACELTHEQFAARPEQLVRHGSRNKVAQFVARRLSGEPVSRILGRREFLGLDFAVTSATLDPRPDTETLVETVIALGREMIAEGRSPRILDLGTGSGCILVSVLNNLNNAWGTGLDIDPAAVGVARANAARHGLGARASFACSSWLDAVSGQFDILVTNPPYIPGAEIEGLASEVADYDPRRALDGGVDGLDAYRAIAAALTVVLKPGGWAVFEIGVDQGDAVEQILRQEASAKAAASTRRWHDLSGKERCIGICV